MNPTVNTDSDYAGKRWNATFNDVAVVGSFAVTGNVTVGGTLDVVGLLTADEVEIDGNLVFDTAGSHEIHWRDASADDFFHIRGTTRTIDIAADDGATGVIDYMDFFYDTHGPVVSLDNGGGASFRFYDHNADPNVALAGDAGDMVSQVAADDLWLCTAGGVAGAAVWKAFVIQADVALGHGEIYVTTPAATTISDTITYVQAAGTYALTTFSTDWDMNTNGQMRYIGTDNRDADVAITFSMTAAANNKVFSFGVAKNGTLITPSRIQRKQGTGADVGAAAVHGFVQVETNDYITLVVRGDTDTTDITFVTVDLFAQDEPP